MWFDSRQQALARRGELLQARSALLRGALAQDSRALQMPLAVADQVLAGGRWLKSHPEAVAVGVAALVLWRPRRVWRLGRRLWSGWRLWRRAQRWQATALAWRLRR
jgi:hypothetical protein